MLMYERVGKVFCGGKIGYWYGASQLYDDIIEHCFVIWGHHDGKGKGNYGT